MFGELNLKIGFDSWVLSGASPSILHDKTSCWLFLLFGALADSGRIKQRKNGSYRMVLKGLDEIDWVQE